MRVETSLTPRQVEILAYLRATTVERGFPPSIREIGKAVGLRSSSSVAAQLRHLMDLGYITRDPNSPRTIVLTDRATNAEICDICGRVLAGTPS